ncbi:MAG: Tex-like N-terminal domain-containing protein [Planctomycetota bacterium]
MSVDLEAIAQRGRCDVSNLRLALPLLEQGYSPPFLARYRRDELGGLDEPTLWALSAAVQTEQQIAARRAELVESWKQTPLADGAIGHAIKKANSQRMLARLARRLKTESREASSDATLLAVRLMNSRQGDGNDIAAIAASVEGISDAEVAVAGVDEAIAKRLAGDPRLISAAVRWLAKNAKVHIAEISDPHGQDDHGPDEDTDAHPLGESIETATEPDASEAQAAIENQSVATDAAPTDASGSQPEANADAAQPETAAVTESDTSETVAVASPQETDSVSESDTPPVADATTVDASVPVESTTDTPATETEVAAESTEGNASSEAPHSESTDAETPDGQPSKPPAAASKETTTKQPANPPAKTSKKQKKISPRQRRRRWLVGVLKPLQGKRLPCDKLSSFQVVMLGRALRSQVAQCAFEYDATKLVAELQRVAAGLNRNLEDKFRQVVLEHEASLREAAESAWWDDLHERASSRLVGITADHLSRQVNRGAVEAKVVMAIDAVGPRTAATAIVSSDGRMLHSEDLPCQLSAAQRTQTVTKMGELIHTHHVDLLVISNGPARRATMIALGDLIGQSPGGSIRWTLADRSGADAYASSGIANDEMRSTPRRFRAAAWLAFSVLQPAQALAKVDPLKLRLSSFQRELSDDAIVGALQDVMTSGASRGGVDVNSAPISWLQKLPGVSSEMADAIDSARREKLFGSRDALLELEHWENAVQSRQAIPFLRVFGGEEVLDGTLIHPEDYPLAKKLASTLEIELPPDTPPGYEPPDYSQPVEPVDPSKLVESPVEAQTATVEDFSSAGESAAEFVVEAAATEAPPSASAETADAAAQADAGEASETADTPAEEAAPEATGESATSESTESPESVSTESETSAPEPAATEPAATEPTATDAAASDTAPAPQNIPERVLRPKPERAKTDKCVKEWQIGGKRAHQLVQWLCDPFGDSDSTGSAPAVMQSMPSLNSLKPGEQAIGIVVGVMPFGVFVELAPDCSGLIHVSRVSDSYVEDLHEAVQVGDVVTAWVSGIDEKRRRVALSALSPEREAELEESRRSRPPRGGRGGGQRGGQQRGGQQRGGQQRGGGGGRADAGQRSSGPPQRSGRGAASGGGRSDARRSGGERGGGRGRDGRGGRGRDGGRGGKKREKKPESYRVVGKQEVKPISDAMQKGEEPLRSFGDLMQFFDQSKTDAKPDPPAAKQPASKQETPKADSEQTAPEATNTESQAETGAADPTPDSESPATPDSNPPAAAEAEAKPPQPSPDPESTPPTKDETPSADASN